MSSSRLFASIALLFAGCSATGGNWESGVNDEGKQMQSLKMEAPSMTEEDQYGYTMPDQYRCDACKVVVHHLTEALQRKQPKNRRLQEWEYQDLFDETCTKGFTGYGVTLEDGENVLSGPGMKRNNLPPADGGAIAMGSIQMGGETWEKRLGEICRKFVYEKIGEDEVYDIFRSEGQLPQELCFSETRDCQLGPKQAKKGSKATEEKNHKKNKAVKGKAGAAQSKDKDLDVSTFISKLAKKHGLATAEYTKKRSFAEWEKLLSQAAERIGNGAESQGSNIVGV